MPPRTTTVHGNISRGGFVTAAIIMLDRGWSSSFISSGTLCSVFGFAPAALAAAYVIALIAFAAESSRALTPHSIPGPPAVGVFGSHAD